MFRIRLCVLFLLPLCLFFSCVLIALFSPSIPGTVAQNLTLSEQSGLGGAFGATSYTQSLAATVTPTSTPKPPTLYGGSGKGGACLGTLGAGNDMIHMDFGWAASLLNTKWMDYAAYRLCNDHYTWETVTVLPLKTVLQTLQWPSDLLASQYANQVVTLEPLRSFDPVTLQAQQQQANPPSTETNTNCQWHVSFAFVDTTIDICEPIRLLVNAGSTAIRGIYQSAAAQITFLWQTPLQPFQDDKTSGLLAVWSTSWSIVLAGITGVIAYGGLRLMIGSAVSWLAYANLAELLPRLLFGLLAAYLSKDFFVMLINGNNALAGIFNHGSLDTVINGKASGVVNESLQIVYGLMGFGLIVEEIGRMALLYLLFAFAPILFFFASLRETQRWAKTAAVAAVVFTFMQAAQAATLDVGGRVLSTVLKNTDGNLTFLNLLISLAILYITLMFFFSLAHMALGGGISPLARGMLKISSGLLPFAAGVAGTAGGVVGGAAGAYARARRSLFPLPDPRKQLSGNTSRRTPGSQPGNMSRRTPVNSSRPTGSRGQANAAPGGKPAVNSGASKSGTSAPGGRTPNNPAVTHPTQTVQNKPGMATGGKTPNNPKVTRPLTVQRKPGGILPSPISGISGPGVRPAGPSAGQGSHTPPQTPRRPMTEDELIEWLNEQDSH